MAVESVSVTPGTGADIAVDEVDDKQYQLFKLDIGADGVAGGPVSSGNPMPVSVSGTATVSGTVAVTNAGITTIAGAVSGTEMQVDVLTMPSTAVTNAGTFVVQENGAALTALQVIDNVVAVEDAVAGSGYSGVPFLAVRQDSHVDLAADGDFISPTVDADGGLRVSIVAGAGSGGTAIADDAAFTVATTSITPVGGVYKSSVDSVDDGDAGAFAMSIDRALHVHIVGDDVGSAVADEDGTVAVGALNVAQTITAQYEYDGTNLVRVRGQHTVAHDAADAGNPEKLGAKAETSLAGVTLVTDGDRTDLYAGVDGVLITRPHCNLEDILSGNASNTDGSSFQVIAAQAAGVKTYITWVTITNTHASTDGYVEFKDGSTTKFTLPAPHSSGAAFALPTPVGGTAATAWNADPSAAITTIIVSMGGFKSKV